jgi:hypothetical protein
MSSPAATDAPLPAATANNRAKPATKGLEP